MRRIGGEKRLKSGLRLWILPGLKGLQRGIELLARLIEHRYAGADHGRPSCGGRGGGRWPLAEIERRTCCGRLARQGRRRLAYERRAWRSGSERARRAGRARISVGIECVRPSRPWRDARLGRGQGRFSNVRPWRGALGAIAKTVFHVLAELLQLRLEPALGVLQFLDPAVGLAKRLLESVDAQHKPGRVAGIALRSAWNVGGWGSLTVEDIELRLNRRRNREADGQSPQRD